MLLSENLISPKTLASRLLLLVVFMALATLPTLLPDPDTVLGADIAVFLLIWLYVARTETLFWLRTHKDLLGAKAEAPASFPTADALPSVGLFVMLLLFVAPLLLFQGLYGVGVIPGDAVFSGVFLGGAIVIVTSGKPLSPVAAAMWNRTPVGRLWLGLFLHGVALSGVVAVLAAEKDSLTLPWLLAAMTVLVWGGFIGLVFFWSFGHLAGGRLLASQPRVARFMDPVPPLFPQILGVYGALYIIMVPAMLNLGAPDEQIVGLIWYWAAVFFGRVYSLSPPLTLIALIAVVRLSVPSEPAGAPLATVSRPQGEVLSQAVSALLLVAATLGFLVLLVQSLKLYTTSL